MVELSWCLLHQAFSCHKWQTCGYQFPQCARYCFYNFSFPRSPSNHFPETISDVLRFLLIRQLTFSCFISLVLPTRSQISKGNSFIKQFPSHPFLTVTHPVLLQMYINWHFWYAAYKFSIVTNSLDTVHNIIFYSKAFLNSYPNIRSSYPLKGRLPGILLSNNLLTSNSTSL